MDDNKKTQITITEDQHFNRNQFNELPNGILTKQDYHVETNKFNNQYTDVNNKIWILNDDYYASYHQPTHLYIAAIRSIISKYTFGLFKVSNL